MKANELMSIRMYKPDKRFIESCRHHGEEVISPRSAFKRKHDALWFAYSGNAVLYFKDTKEYAFLENMEEEIKRLDIELDNIILFEYETGYNLSEEISNGGLGDMFEDIILQWEKYFKQELRPTKLLGNMVIEAALNEHTLPSISFVTAWNMWGCKDDYTGEYDCGCDYAGIVDMGNLTEKEIEG